MVRHRSQQKEFHALLLGVIFILGFHGSVYAQAGPCPLDDRPTIVDAASEHIDPKINGVPLSKFSRINEDFDSARGKMEWFQAGNGNYLVLLRQKANPDSDDPNEQKDQVSAFWGTKERLFLLEKKEARGTLDDFTFDYVTSYSNSDVDTRSFRFRADSIELSVGDETLHLKQTTDISNDLNPKEIPLFKAPPLQNNVVAPLRVKGTDDLYIITNSGLEEGLGIVDADGYTPQRASRGKIGALAEVRVESIGQGVMSEFFTILSDGTRIHTQRPNRGKSTIVFPDKREAVVEQIPHTEFRGLKEILVESDLPYLDERITLPSPADIPSTN